MYIHVHLGQKSFSSFETFFRKFENFRFFVFFREKNVKRTLTRRFSPVIEMVTSDNSESNGMSQVRRPPVSCFVVNKCTLCAFERSIVLGIARSRVHYGKRTPTILPIGRQQ